MSNSMRELDAWAIMHVGTAEANELFDIVGRALAAEREPRWQPIETAPKPKIHEKTIPVLLAFHYPKSASDPKSMLPGTAKWAGKFWGCLVMSWNASNQCWDDGMGNSTDDWDAESEQPTHWMPLPPAPRAETP